MYYVATQGEKLRAISLHEEIEKMAGCDWQAATTARKMIARLQLLRSPALLRRVLRLRADDFVLLDTETGRGRSPLRDMRRVRLHPRRHAAALARRPPWRTQEDARLDRR